MGNDVLQEFTLNISAKSDMDAISAHICTKFLKDLLALNERCESTRKQFKVTYIIVDVEE